MQDKKKLYEQNIAAQLAKWRADIDKLQAKGASADARLKYAKQIDMLELKYDEGKRKLKEIAESTEEAWESIKDGADSLWDTMKSTFAEIKDKFKD